MNYGVYWEFVYLDDIYTIYTANFLDILRDIGTFEQLYWVYTNFIWFSTIYLCHSKETTGFDNTFRLLIN